MLEKRIKKNLTFSILAIFYLVACKNSTLSIEEKTNLTVDTIAKPQTFQSTEEISKDTIHYDTLIFPKEKDFISKILTTGIFHSDEVWENADKEKWYGLFQDKTNFYLAETKLKIKRAHDVVLDENEEETTGWNVQTTNKDTSIVLISGLNFLMNHPIQACFLQKDQILPGDTLRISYLNNDYQLIATGGKKQEENNPDQFVVWNYKLYLTASKNGESITELLVAQPNFDDNMINILFAGDIDNDGILDLIIDISRHYNANSPTLYLSKPAENKNILKIVGNHTQVGC